MGNFQLLYFKVRPIVLTSLAAIFLISMISFYWRMDFALTNLAFEKIYKTETIIYQKPNGETGRLRVLTVHNSEERWTTPSDLSEANDGDHSMRSGVTLATSPKKLVLESIKQFLEDRIGNDVFRDSDVWLNQSWKSGGGKYISALDNADKEMLRNVLLELRQLQQVNKTEAVQSHLEEEDDSSTDGGIIDEDSAEVGEFKFRAHGRLNVRRLVLYSSHRTALTEFSVITLSPTVLESLGGPVHNTCLWLQDGSTKSPGHFSSLEDMSSTGRLNDQSGSLTLRYVRDTHGRNYDSVVIHCSFPQAVGTDRTGGFLYLNISHGAESSELIPVFHERPGQLNASMYELTTFQYEYVYCSAPVWTNLSATHVKQWFMYHHTLAKGNIRYFFYHNIGIDPKTMAVLKPFIDMGILTVINQQRERDYDVWYHTQVPAMNDCMNRARFLAKWVLFWDLDEYLHLPPPLTLPALLEEVERKGAPWISLGNMFYSRTYCSPDSGRGDWAVERMLYRLEKPLCGLDEIAHVCHGPMGHRKWIANPRLVKVASIHNALDPEWGGITLDTAVARINHYRGLAAPDAVETSCTIIKHPLDVNDTKVAVDGWWFKDDALANFTTGSLKTLSQSFPVLQTLAQVSES